MMHTMFSTMLSHLEADKSEELYNAVVSGDTDEMFTTASEILEESGCFPKDSFFNMLINDRRTKNPEESDKIRNAGNEHFSNGKFRAALVCYNKALAYAPGGSSQMKLAYSNISAVAKAIKAYQSCDKIVDACLAMDCPKDLKAKLQKRKREVRDLNKVDISRETKREKMKSDLMKFLNINETNRNVQLPCASDDVAVEEINGKKKVIAAKDIASGSIIAMERAFVSCSIEEQYSSCYYCHRMAFFFIPCDNCSNALFCSDNCKIKCMEEYHRIECKIIPFLGRLYESPAVKLSTRAAIKMSMKMSWDELHEASKKMGAARLKTASVQEAYDPKNPLSALSYDEDNGPNRDKMFYESLIFALIVDCLSHVNNYLPRGYEKKRALACIAINLYAKFTKKLEISNCAYDYSEGELESRLHRIMGMFSFTSKLAHSCEPNLLAVGFNDTVALVTVQKIKKGEELTISYIDHFMEISLEHQCLVPPPLQRQQALLNATNVKCECRVCIQNFDCQFFCQSYKVTKFSQQRVYDQLITDMISGELDKQWSSARILLDEFTGPEFYVSTQRLLGFKQLTAVLEIYQYAHTENVTYESEPQATSSYGRPFTWTKNLNTVK